MEHEKGYFVCRVLFATLRVGAKRKLRLNADEALPVGVVLDPSVGVVV